MPSESPTAKRSSSASPPIRDEIHRGLLWDGLQRGVIDTIGSDHSPCPPEMKQLEIGNFMAAWGGIASLQLTLPIVWTECLARQIPLEQMFRLARPANPARLVGLSARKGRIAAGCDADLDGLESGIRLDRPRHQFAASAQTHAVRGN